MVKYCSKCVYDDTTPGIKFNSKGVCNYCDMHQDLEDAYPMNNESWNKLKAIAKEIKKAGKGKKYDCVIGVSGGCDSSYLCYLAKKKLGLRPVAAHFDNTWNSKTAVENISRVLDKLEIPLYTYVMDNEEFCDMARSFLEASVPEIDAITDIGLATTLYLAAEKYKVKYILNGHSFRTEGISPIGMFYFDGKYIEDIHKKFGKMPMKRFPNLELSKWLKWLFMGIKRIRPLYYIDYDKAKAKEFLNKEYGWEWYGGAHMENRYSYFNHRYLLPKKFDTDLRNIEFSALVRSGQKDRDDALKELKTPVPIPDDIIDEIKKRLDLTDEDLERILKTKPKKFTDYETYYPTFKRMKPLFWVMQKMDLVPKSFYMKYCH